MRIRNRGLFGHFRNIHFLIFVTIYKLNLVNLINKKYSLPNHFLNYFKTILLRLR